MQWKTNVGLDWVVALRVIISEFPVLVREHLGRLSARGYQMFFYRSASFALPSDVGRLTRAVSAPRVLRTRLPWGSLEFQVSGYLGEIAQSFSTTR